MYCTNSCRFKNTYTWYGKVYCAQKRGHAIKHWCKDGEAYQKLYISSGYKRVIADIVILEQNVPEKFYV
jgi:uncharacterized protein CbrC (UPF0167 family)